MAHAEQMQYLASVRVRYPRHFDEANVVEVGSRWINGTARGFFTGCLYTGVDLQEGPGVDVVARAKDYRPDRPPDTVVCCEVLEHDRDWRETVEVMVYWLRPGGLLVATWAGPARPEHGTRRTGEEYGDDPDYYRNVSTEEFREAVGGRLTNLEVVEGRGGQDVYACGFKP